MHIDTVEVDDGNEEHLTRHGVSVIEIHHVFANGPDVRRNRRNRTATHIARGATEGGRQVLVPFIDRGGGTVRPITAWEVAR